MKVKNTSKRVIKLLNGKDKVTLIPGTSDVYNVTDCPDVQFLIAAGDLIKTVGNAVVVDQPAGDKTDDTPKA